MSGWKTWMTRLAWGIAVWAVFASPGLADDASLGVDTGAVAEPETVFSGADVWNTTAGMTYADFGEDPLPADFFCEGSRPFDGRVSLHGVPLVTDPPGFLGNADTVVHRLDDAVFDENGFAATRLRFMAISLESTEPIDVGCNYPLDVKVRLADGEQPVSEMMIFKETEDGGFYSAPLELRVEVAFVPVGNLGGEVHTVTRDISLGPGSESFWTTTARVGRTIYGEPVRVDTDNDGVADSSFPGFSNFNPGYVLSSNGTQWYADPPTCPCGQCVRTTCHCNPNSCDPDEPSGLCTHLHCVYYCGSCVGTISRCEIDEDPALGTL